MSEPAFNFVPTANRSKAHNKGVDAQSHEHLIHGTIPRTLAKNYLLGKQISLTTPVLTGLHQALPGLAGQVIAAGRAGASLGKHIQGAEMMSLEELVYHPSFDWGTSGAKPMGCSRNPRTPLVAKFNQFRGVSAELLPANSSRGTSKYRAATETQTSVPYLSELLRFLSDQVAAEKEAFLDLQRERQAHPVVGTVSETLAGVRAGFVSVKLPDENIWDQVFVKLNEARSLLADGQGDTANVSAAKEKLASAVRLFQAAHRKTYEYRSRTEAGAQTAASILRGIEVACDITLVILSGGLGAAESNVLKLGVKGMFKLAASHAARVGLGRTALKAAVVAGANKLVQGSAEQGAAVAIGEEQAFDLSKVVADAGEHAAMNLVGVLVGGALSKVFMRTLGQALGKGLTAEQITALAEKYGAVRALPPELFVQHGGWRFLVGLLGDACTTTLTTALSLVIGQMRSGGQQHMTGGQFAELVVEQMIRNGLLQLVIGALTHTTIANRKGDSIGRYQKSGMPENRIDGHVAGIDLTESVEVITLREGTIVRQLQIPGAPQGDYYSPGMYRPEELGIGPKGLDLRSGQIVEKTVMLYEVVKDVAVLKSSCSKPVDKWSIANVAQPTTGGGTQYFTTDKSAFKPVGLSDKTGGR